MGNTCLVSTFSSLNISPPKNKTQKNKFLADSIKVGDLFYIAKVKIICHSHFFGSNEVMCFTKILTFYREGHCGKMDYLLRIKAIVSPGIIVTFCCC